MPISDVYIVESLLQSTEANTDPLRWREVHSVAHASPEFIASAGPVRIALSDIHHMSGTRLCLTLSLEDEEIFIQEPEPSGWWGRRYRCEEDRRTAHAIRRLHEAAARQCRRRESRAAAETDRIRERIFRQVLFGSPGLPR